MLDVLRNRSPKMAFPERDDTIETLVFDRADDPFSVGIRVGV
jgi:hypothetical protein